MLLIPDVLWNGFFSGCFVHCWFHSHDWKKWPCDDEFMIVWWVNLCRRGSCFTVCLQVCWVLHFLTRCNLRYVTEKSSTDAKSIAWIRFSSNLELLGNLQMLGCKLWPSGLRNVYHHVITCFESREWNQWFAKWPGKRKPFQRTSGINRS